MRLIIALIFFLISAVLYGQEKSIDELKAEKSELENKISILQDQLNEINAQMIY